MGWYSVDMNGMTNTYHISRLGAFGGGVPRDRDGYVHLTAQGWLESPEGQEAYDSYLAQDPDDPEGAQEWAEEWAEQQADAARAATERAEL